jgi:hypothetical protein
MIELRTSLGADLVFVLVRVILLATPLLFVSAGGARAGVVTWGSGFPASTGTPTTVSLGGGSTVQLAVTTGGTRGINAVDLGTSGTAETGLDYTNLRTVAIFNGGGSSSVVTTLTFTNFVPGPRHMRGFIMVGAVDELSTPITVTSSVIGAVQTWTQVGSSFDMSATEADPITWNAGSGQLSTSTVDNSIDSDGIVLDIGSIEQYGTITLSLSQHLQDGIYYSIGEEMAPEVPATSNRGLVFTAVLLIMTGATSARPQFRRAAFRE